MVSMLRANTETSKVWPTSAVSATASVMAMRLSTSGRPAATTAPKTMQQDDERDGHADALAALQVASRRSG